MSLPFRNAFALAGLGLIAACSGTGGGAQSPCTDPATSEKYMLQWMDDVASAKKAGKLTVAQVVDIHGKAYEKLSMLKGKDMSGYCAHLDALRKDAGF